MGELPSPAPMWLLFAGRFLAITGVVGVVTSSILFSTSFELAGRHPYQDDRKRLCQTHVSRYEIGMLLAEIIV